MRQRAARFMAVCAALALSGCFDLDQDITFRDDGTVLIDTKFSVDAALLAMTEGPGSGRFCAPDDEADLDRQGYVTKIESRSADGNLICHIVVEGAADKVLPLMSSRSAFGKVAAGDNGETPQFMFESSGEDRATLTISIPADDRELASNAENPMAKSMSAMLLAKLSGHSMDWSVTAPRIVSTSGTLSSDGRTATHSIALAQFMGKHDAFVFRTEIGYSRGVFDWLLDLLK